MNRFNFDESERELQRVQKSLKANKILDSRQLLATLDSLLLTRNQIANISYKDNLVFMYLFVVSFQSSRNILQENDASLCTRPHSWCCCGY